MAEYGQGSRSIANMVFVVILAALVVGVGFMTWDMVHTALSHPTA